MSDPSRETEGEKPSDDGYEVNEDEQTTTFKSVGMVSSLPSLGQPSLFESKGGFGNAPPLGISRPPSFGAKPALGISRPPSFGAKPSSVFGVKHEWCASMSPTVWDVKGEDLEMVPMDFPLERTHREIPEGASKVASRISDALRSLSIETEFDCEQAKAKCKTNDCVNFRIRLYAGSESGEPVIVEVQRRNGSASSFMRSCRAILDAAEGKELKAASSRALPPFKKPVGEMKFLQSVKPVAMPVAPDPLNSVKDMLRSSQRDTNVLGLENLGCLTDPVKTSPCTAVRVAKAVILGDDLREEIRVLTERDVFSDEDEALAKHAEHLRHLALVVFANSLALCHQDGCLCDAIKEKTWFADHLIPSLLDELKRAESCANGAYQAACCVLSLVSSSPAAKQLVLDNGGAKILTDANAFGASRHELLSSETMLCLKVVDAASIAV